MRSVGQSVRKKDSAALLSGKPVYTEDVSPKNCLQVVILRSPHAHAMIEEIDVSRALKAAGVACALTYHDVPDIRFTQAGQTYPEFSPYDRLILDRHLRCVGDPVAIVAAATREQAEAAIRLIRVKYQILPAILDAKTAKDNPVCIHPEENWRALVPCGADNRRNLVAEGRDESGDVEAELAACDIIIEQDYSTLANQQAMMETFRASTQLDAYGRLTVISSTQVPFHGAPQVATALGIPKNQVRVIKAAHRRRFRRKADDGLRGLSRYRDDENGLAAMIIYTRQESQTISSPRHAMNIHVRLGATKDGVIRAVDMFTLSNSGAYGEHGPTTVGPFRSQIHSALYA